MTHAVGAAEEKGEKTGQEGETYRTTPHYTGRPENGSISDPAAKYDANHIQKTT
jgi:hypothetical protein